MSCFLLRFAVAIADVSVAVEVSVELEIRCDDVRLSVSACVILDVDSKLCIRFLGTPFVVIVAQNIEDARASGNTALSSPCWDMLALMRRVVNYHCSSVWQRQVELFDASSIRVWCKEERVIPVCLYTHQWPPFIVDPIELCLRSLAPFLRLKPSAVVPCLMHSICILSYVVSLVVSVALRTGV
ncbi:hypothetical protein F511_15006 [Dorcoceras hygrometricum]|uniref:Secreted protein n=1 Tax=Dorcoceras hygrometricum TaxID=472368 RepID=A0A2Z7CSV5_9LAMI|nr:hypothetical protein F511_15006 [Dorcoceras hygrometricum]